MDPLSLTASLIAVGQGAQAGLNTIKSIKAIWRVPAEIEDLKLRLQELNETLNDILAFISDSKGFPSSRSLAAPVARAKAIVVKVNGLLRSVPLNRLHLSSTNQARINFMRKSSEVKSLINDLQIVRIDVCVHFGLVIPMPKCFFLSSTTWYSLPERSMLKQVASTVNFSIEAHGQSFERMSQQLAVVISQTSTLNRSTPVPSLMKDGTCDEISFSRQAAAKPCGNRSSQASFDDQFAFSPPGNESKNGEESNQDCPAWCSCQCHQRRTLKSPWMFNSVLGSLQIYFSGGRPDCNEYKCRRSERAPTSILYRFPRYLLSRYMRMTMTWTLIDGPRYSLRFPRVTDWSHRYWDFCVQGDLGAIQKLFSAGKASALDLNLIGGNALIYNCVLGNLPLTKFLLENGADLEVKDDAGNVAGEELWKFALSGDYGADGISIVEALTRNVKSDYKERWRFNLLHKIVLALSERDLQAELELSTALLNQGDAQQKTPLCWAVIVEGEVLRH